VKQKLIVYVAQIQPDIYGTTVIITLSVYMQLYTIMSNWFIQFATEPGDILIVLIIVLARAMISQISLLQ